MGRLADRGFERLADVDERYLATLFFLGLLAYILALIYESLGYSADARLFPLIVGVPLAILLVAKVLLLLLQDRLDLHVVGLFEDVGDLNIASTREVGDKSVQYRREFSMILWIGGLLLLIYLFGNLAAVPIFIFAFIFAYERDLLRAAIAAIVTFAFIYLLFVQILDATLWRGIVPIGRFLP